MPASGSSHCVLVVEDETFLATLLEDILVAAGYRVLSAARVDAALQIVLSGAPIDAALLDIDVNGVEVFPVAAKLRESGVPFVFASGYGREGLPSDYADCPVVQKPYLPDSITTALWRSLAGGDVS
jgi:CheY-like chemotaxis protein